MIGRKKLSTIREELRRALGDSGKDPIRWLEERLAAREETGSEAKGGEVLRSLRGFLKVPEKGKPRKRRSGLKK